MENVHRLKLNSATHNDHFALSFLDVGLKREAGQMARGERERERRCKWKNKKKVENVVAVAVMC